MLSRFCPKIFTVINFRGAQAAIVVYDITNADTFARAKTWVRELQRQVNILVEWERPIHVVDNGIRHD